MLSLYKNTPGFSIIEMIIVIAILAVLATVVVTNFPSFLSNSSLNNNTQQFVSVLKLAQNRALASENYSQFGIYINTGVSPHQYISFKGASYTSRDTSADKVYVLDSTVEFYGINLGGGSEIVFDKLTGASEETGDISIRIKNDTSKSKTVYITSSGTVSLNQPTTASDDSRVKDYRHIQFNYSQAINTASDSLTLTFDNSQTVVVPFNSYLSAGELQWQKTVSVGGANQIVEINTHWLNSPDTLFSVRRDGRFNNKSLKITISGDASGYLAQYSADGSSVGYTSSGVSNFARQ